MKKSLLIGLAIVVAGFPIYAQTQIEQCGTMKLLQQHLAVDPNLKTRMQETEANARAWEVANNKKTLSSIVRIPTVVHVIHNTSLPDQNIPDSVIYSQMSVLNEDFRRMNADAVNTRIIFDSIAADVEVAFALASFDTAGNSITGINRVTTTETGFDVLFGLNDMKYTASGGADAWPPDQYLNIWVCNMTLFGIPGAVLGFAQFPGDDPATDGVVIHYTQMGRTSDPVQSDSSLGRTATHEVGHWLGLRHTWADDQSSCDSSDFVDDTPNQAGESSYDCNLSINSCSTEASFWGAIDPPDMVENFMDYSSDECSNMFSMGQKTRMLSFLNTDRLPLQSATACTLVNLTELSGPTEIEIYPNPSSGFFNIAPLAEGKESRIEVYDPMGQCVFKSTISEKTNFNLSHLSNGVYFVRGTSAKHAASSKIVIAK